MAATFCPMIYQKPVSGPLAEIQILATRHCRDAQQCLRATTV
jgi:hypothetical protein